MKSITVMTTKNIDDIVVNIRAVRSAFGFIPSVNANVIVIVTPETIVSNHLNSSTLHIAYNPYAMRQLIATAMIVLTKSIFIILLIKKVTCFFSIHYIAYQ